MKTASALRAAFTMSGKYDIPGKFLEIKGYDEFGAPRTERIAMVDSERMERDIAGMLGHGEAS